MDGDEPEPDTEDESPAGGGQDETPELQYPNVYVFVEDFLLNAYARTDRTAPEQRQQPHWCELWWEHSEANSRLRGLWRAYEQLRNDAGTGMSTWWRDHADPCMAQLMSPSGPFERCIPASEGTPMQHEVLPDLRSRPLPKRLRYQNTIHAPPASSENDSARDEAVEDEAAGDD